jgi:hypothetical protein
MLGNGSPPFDGAAGSDADAFDATLDGDQSPRSLWSANVCEHDIPVGRICGVG